jgi:hypothetical protein
MISEFLSPQHGASSGCGQRNGFWIRMVAANILNKQSQTAEMGWFSSLGVGRGADNQSPLKLTMLQTIHEDTYLVWGRERG